MRWWQIVDYLDDNSIPYEVVPGWSYLDKDYEVEYEGVSIEICSTTNEIIYGNINSNQGNVKDLRDFSSVEELITFIEEFSNQESKAKAFVCKNEIK